VVVLFFGVGTLALPLQILMNDLDLLYKHQFFEDKAEGFYPIEIDLVEKMPRF
jgi:hypothetical protein